MNAIADTTTMPTTRSWTVGLTCLKASTPLAPVSMAPYAFTDMMVTSATAETITVNVPNPDSSESPTWRTAVTTSEVGRADPSTAPSDISQMADPAAPR